MKPIHKLNNGRGATLCHTCSVIITTGLTEDLYCEKCKPKQETLEEAGVAYAKTVNENHTSHMLGFHNGAKWQQERSYSEEDLRTAFINGMANVAINDFEFDVDTWFKQFKKK